MSTHRLVVAGVLSAIAAFAVSVMFGWTLQDAHEDNGSSLPVSDFASCAAAGYPVMESYPRRCAIPDGASFVEDIGNALDKADLIRVVSPQPNEVVTSPLVVEGEARGTWFFEGNFPVRLVNGSGDELALGIAIAQGEWMTEAFVPFSVELQFRSPGRKSGTLILQKDNPSGLPEYEDELRIPVRFGP